MLVIFDVRKHFKPSFWRDVLEAWALYNYEKAEEMTKDQVMNQYIWYNSHVLIEKKLVFFVKAWNEGLETI